MPAPANTPIELPQLVRIDLSRLQPGWGHAPHSHEVHEIAYVRRGGGILRAGGREIPVGRGAIYVFLPGEPHGGDTGLGATEILWVAIRFPGAAAVVRDRSPAPFFLTGATAAAVAPPLGALADLLSSLPPRPSPESPLPDAALPHVLALLAAMIEPVRAFAAGSARQRELAEQALARIARDARRPPTLAALAAKLGVTADHLGRALGAVTGRTYPDLIADQRVRAARELLADAGLPVREIARRVGLSSPRALARLCRRVTGKAPRDLRP